MKKKALGKGLKAFLPEDYGILKEERFIDLEINLLKPSPNQPRIDFNEDTIQELAASIKETGVLQPVVVTPEKGYYKIIIGERRWRASQVAGLDKIPAVVRSMTEEQQLEASLVENLQREDLNPVEIAKAYQNMTKKLNYTQQEVADKVGKDRASVANYMRLLKLPQVIQDMISDGNLSMGHARAMIPLDNPESQISISRQIVKNNLSVRDVEKKINQLKQKLRKKQISPPDPNLAALQEEFLKLLGTKVSIEGNQGRGVVKIYYYTMDELNHLYEKIKGEVQ